MKMKAHVTFFDFGRANRLGATRIVSDDDWGRQVAWWLNGRVLGCYVSVSIPWRRRLS